MVKNGMANDESGSDRFSDALRDNNPGRGPLGVALIGEHAPHDYANIRGNLGGVQEMTDLVTLLLADFRGVVINEAVLEELLDALADAGKLGQQRTAVAPARWQAGILKILEYLQTGPGPIRLYAVLAAWDDPLLDDINKHLSQSKFAARLGLSKEAVGKEMELARKHFKLPKRRDQHTAQACEKMKIKRLSQLQPSQIK